MGQDWKGINGTQKSHKDLSYSLIFINFIKWGKLQYSSRFSTFSFHNKPIIEALGRTDGTLHQEKHQMWETHNISTVKSLTYLKSGSPHCKLCEREVMVGIEVWILTLLLYHRNIFIFSKERKKPSPSYTCLKKKKINIKLLSCFPCSPTFPSVCEFYSCKLVTDTHLTFHLLKY